MGNKYHKYFWLSTIYIIIKLEFCFWYLTFFSIVRVVSLVSQEKSGFLFLQGRLLLPWKKKIPKIPKTEFQFIDNLTS